MVFLKESKDRRGNAVISRLGNKSFYKRTVAPMDPVKVSDRNDTAFIYIRVTAEFFYF
jgi:hypothetical protein